MNRLAFAVALLAACAKPDGSIHEGSVVRIHYTLIVDRAVRETSEGRDPLQFRAGSGGVIAGLDEALAGARAGQEMTVVVPPEKAYGGVKAEEIETVPLESLKDMGKIEPGVSIHGLRRGKPASAKVRAVEGGSAILDFNHELAGKTLTFKVKVVSVE